MREKCHVFLDTSKYSSHSTGTDALYAEIPLLTLPQQTFASRVSSSLIHALNCPEISSVLIAPDIDTYERTAIDLATNEETYNKLRSSLKDCVKTGPLFDHAKWVKNWEKELSKIWKAYL